MSIKRSAIVSHPGTVISQVYMFQLGINQTQLAEKIGCTHRKVNEVINGKRGVTADFALDLERVFGVSASLFLKLQAEYDLAQARAKRKRVA